MYSSARSGVWVFLVLVLTAGSYVSFGQRSGNTAGSNGGIHSIRGRIYLPNGRSLDRSVKIELQNIANPTQSVYTDSNGGFAFTGLTGGSYTVVVDAGEPFEIARESFYIDQEVQGQNFRVTPIPRNLSSPIHLIAKRGESLKNEILNAKWSNVPKVVIEHYKRGIEFVQSGKDGDAETEFRKSVETSPSFAPAHSELAKLALKTGKIDNAIESCKSAIRYDETNFDAHITLGIAFLNQRKYDLAEPELVTAAYLNRAAVTPHYYLGIVYFVNNDPDIARKAFETVKELKGGARLPSTHKYLGRIYMAKKLDKEALAEFETYLRLVPKAQDAEKINKDIADIKSRQN